MFDDPENSLQLIRLERSRQRAIELHKADRRKHVRQVFSSSSRFEGSFN